MAALSTKSPYPGCINAVISAYEYLLARGVDPAKIVLAGDSAGGKKV